MKIILTSFSDIKRQSVKNVFEKFNIKVSDFEIDCYKTKIVVEQPLGVRQTIDICKDRITQVQKTVSVSELAKYDYIMSIENGINLDLEHNDRGVMHPTDFVVVAVYSTKINRLFVECSGIDADSENIGTIPIRDYVYEERKLKPYMDLVDKITNARTFGNMIHERTPTIPGNNWMKELCGIDRHDQIAWVVERHLPMMKLINDFVIYPDFPKKKILFRDIIGSMSNPEHLETVMSKIAENFEKSGLTDYEDSQETRDGCVNYIVGLDARGFILGGALATYLNAKVNGKYDNWKKVGFIPIRKQGKLPGECYTVTYGKEYGVDKFEIQKDAIKVRNPKCTKVNIVVIDDILATGGTAKAAIDLLKHFDCIGRVSLVFLDKVDGLNPDLGDYNQYIVLDNYEHIHNYD
jgi:adenine phosphoribosyltransferase